MKVLEGEKTELQGKLNEVENCKQELEEKLNRTESDKMDLDEKLKEIFTGNNSLMLLDGCNIRNVYFHAVVVLSK